MNPNRAFVLAWAATLAMVSAPGPARGLVLSYTGSLSIRIAPPGLNLPSLVTPGSGTAIVNGSGPGAHIHTLDLAGSPFAATNVSVPIASGKADPIRGLVLTVHNQGGAFADAGGTLNGVMPLQGVAKLCLFDSCSVAVANLSVPLSVVGDGGTMFFNRFGAQMTVVGAPWTTGTAAIGASTAMGFAHAVGSGTSSTAALGGSVRLVTPIFISTNIADFAVVPAFGILDLEWVPEPTTFVLLASGVALLAAAGRSSAQRR